MQFRKKDIRDNILAAAREEFWKNGFEKASIRNITAAAKTSKSNVYNYFNDKDALFVAVVESTMTGIKTGFEKLRANNPNTSSETYTVAAQKKVIEEIMSFVYSNQEDLKLLFFRSSGSTLYGFKDKLIEEMANVLSNWISYVAPDKNISSFFIQTVAGFYIGSIEQMLAKDVTAGNAGCHFEVFLEFVYGGWNAVLKQNTIE